MVRKHTPGQLESLFLMLTYNVSQLMKKFSTRMGVQLDVVSKRHSVEQMARELGVISSLHAAEVKMKPYG